MKKSLIVIAGSALLASSLMAQNSLARGFGGFDRQGQGPRSAMMADLSATHGPHHRAEGPKILRLAGILELTEAQVTEIQAIYDANEEPLNVNKEVMKATRDSLRELIMAETYDEATAQALAETVANLIEERVLLKTKAKFDVMQILTPEQKTRLEQIRTLFRGFHAEDNDEADAGDSDDTDGADDTDSGDDNDQAPVVTP